MILIDLSYPIDEKTKIYPGDSHVYLQQEKYHRTDGFSTSRLEIGLHTGTHIDAPMHMFENGKKITDYSLESFYGPSVLIDVRDENIILFKENYNNLIKENDIVLFYTGHDKNYSNDNYFTDHPVFDPEFSQFLVDKKIKMAGMDLPSPDMAPYLIHKKFLENEIIILENMRNLNKLINKNFELYAFPLNINSDSSLVRAVARIL